MLKNKIEICTADIRQAVESASFSLEALVRSYDLLDLILSYVSEYAGFSGDAGFSGNPGFSGDAGFSGNPGFSGDAGLKSVVEDYCETYEKNHLELETLFDEDKLKSQVNSSLESLRQKLNDTRYEAAAAASLHEFAKEVFEIWQTSGIFARRRALRELRERAGFRLESHRIGNYVAKTFDLMNEAQARFAKAQQELFAADVTYKVQPGLYGKIYDVLTKDIRSCDVLPRVSVHMMS